MSTLLRTIAIAGSGFSGTVVAANLLRHPPPGPTRLLLIERGPLFSRGLAYAPRDYPYLLNVPASRMSANSSDPQEFLRYAQRRLPFAGGEDFLPRALYGEYLEELLLAAELSAPRSIRLEKIRAEVCGIERTDRSLPLQLKLADQQVLIADDVVLALGNPPPAPFPAAAGCEDHERFVSNPWATRLDFSAQQQVLVIGTGLTMADVVSAASAANKTPPVIHAISRHGLIPPRQTAFRPEGFKGDGNALLLATAASLRRTVQVVRLLAQEAEQAGGDWREAITFVRNMAPVLWQRLSEQGRRRFLRHVRVYWDSHRHRLPLPVLERIEQLQRTGKLQLKAGRIVRIVPADSKVQVSWCARGQQKVQQLTVDRVINCTGPDYDLRRSREPLVRTLLQNGLAVRDTLGLGLKTGPNGALVDADGWPGTHLYYVGPMLRAEHWEATAAAELRVHAEKLAAHLSAAA